MEKITGSLEVITFYNAENGYSVLKIAPDQKNLAAASRQGYITVTGNLPELSVGEYLEIEGDWVNHAKHGQQFTAQFVRQIQPSTVEGIKRYLGSGLLKGVGPKTAERIVDTFGEQTLEVIDKTPKRLREVQEIGPKRMRMIIQAWQEQKQIQDIMIFLHEYGVTTNLALKIFKQYGENSLPIVKSNPYQLSRDIFGVGFKTADRLARSMGLANDHPSRIEAGLMYILEQKVQDGNVFYPHGLLVSEASELLDVEMHLVPPAIQRLELEEMVILDAVPLNGETFPQQDQVKNAVYQTPYYFAEIGVSNQLSRLSEAIPSKLSDLPPLFTSLEGGTGLSDQQRQAILDVFTHPISILTGGPGTGKTTTIRSLISALEGAGKKFALTSPTGRAAKRMSEATDKPASTIHRLLEYAPPEGFQRDEDNPLDVDLLVVDESSMLDIILANHLLKAIQPGTHILFVGDFDQLPSVGAGDFLRDLVKSQKVHITRLTTIFRQSEGSDIIENAHLINRGERPEFAKQSVDFFLFPANTPEEAADWVEDLVINRIPQKFELCSKTDIQVLVPMYRGPAGIHALNERLQNALNPSKLMKPEKKLFGQVFRVGDKVMQVRNDYEKTVFNGDIGEISDISNIQQTLTVEYEGRAVEYDWSEGDQIVLAYAISVHKAQGSEFPAVVLPLLTQHYMMLQRNLLYTGITRAKKICVLVSNPKAIAIAVKNNQVTQRYTALDWRLGQGK